jgi:hypothetical protein
VTGDHRDPLAETSRLVVDGTNLLHALRRGSGAAPPAALVGRLRAAIPAPVVIDVVFDGPPDPGMSSRRAASGMTLHHSGRRSADALIAMLVGGPLERPDPLGASGTLVVTDDVGLRGRVRALGARTAGTSWLLGRVDRVGLSAPAAGRRRPPPPPAAGPGDDRDGDREPWKPGRGATTKRGNPRRTPRHRRRPPTR